VNGIGEGQEKRDRDLLTKGKGRIVFGTSPGEGKDALLGKGLLNEDTKPWDLLHPSRGTHRTRARPNAPEKRQSGEEGKLREEPAPIFS